MRELLLNYLPACVLGFIYIFCTFRTAFKLDEWKQKINEGNTERVLHDLKNVVKQNLELKNDLDQFIRENESLKKIIEEDITNLVKDLEEIKLKVQEEVDKKAEEQKEE